MDRQHSDDAHLVREVLRGSAEAKRAFAERMVCVGRLLAAQNARLRRPLDTNDLLDVAQDVQLLVWRKLGNFAGRSRLETWVFGFCQHALRKKLSRLDDQASRRRELERHARENEPAAPDPLGPQPDTNLGRFLRHLSARESQVIDLHHAHALEFPEVAQRLEISVSSVKTHYYRAIDKLRDVVGAQDGVTS